MNPRSRVRSVLAALAVGALVVAVQVVGLGGAAIAQPAGLQPPQDIATGSPPAGWPVPPTVTAEAFLLVDVATGQVLAARNNDVRRPVASTVKILTAITVLQRTDLADRVTVGTEVDGFAADSAGVGLDPGDTWSVEDLLEGLVARSGNDAAAGLALAIGGSIESFVGLMRDDAVALGLSGVTLATPDGLADVNRLSASDLALLARVALEDPRFAAIAARPVVELPGLGPIASRNELLSTYPGADGVKTGYTSAAGRCLVASVQRDGRHLLAVVLGSDGATGHFADARALLDHAFAAFRPVEVAGPGPELRVKVPGSWVSFDAPPATLQVPDGSDVVHRVELPLRTADATEIAATITWEEHTIAEVRLDGPTSGSDGAASPGGWLAERTYTAMRAATNEGLWPQVDRS